MSPGMFAVSTLKVDVVFGRSERVKCDNYALEMDVEDDRKIHRCHCSPRDPSEIRQARLLGHRCHTVLSIAQFMSKYAL